MRGQTAEQAGRRGAGARAGLVAVLAVAGVLLVAVLAVWAASAGGDPVLTGDGPDRLRVDTPTPTPSPSESETPSPRPPAPEPGEPPAVLAVLAWVVVGGFWLVVAAGVVLAVRGLWRRAGPLRRTPPAEDVAFEVLEQPARVGEQLRRDAAAQRALLEEGEPRTAVEACWHRFEVQAREAGLPREEWETSSEFTYRMLDLVGADPHATLVLGELYREARFSEHPLDEDAREAARAALASIHLSVASASARGWTS